MRRHSCTRLIAPTPALLALALLAAGCQTTPAPRTAEPAALKPARAAPRPAFPQPDRPLPGPEKLDSDLVMVPVAWDSRGCVMYRMQSNKRPRLQAVFFRTRAGDFSTIEEEAACT